MRVVRIGLRVYEEFHPQLFAWLKSLEDEVLPHGEKSRRILDLLEQALVGAPPPVPAVENTALRIVVREELEALRSVWEAVMESVLARYSMQVISSPATDDSREDPRAAALLERMHGLLLDDDD